MAENPFQSLISPNTHQANLYDMRMMSMANRMETPFERGMGRAGGRGGLSGNPMLGSMMGAANEPDYSQFTYDPVMRQRAIAAGVQPLEASQVQQNTFLPNTGFFGRHPNLSRALEGGLFAAASTPSSGGIASKGENISNALEGMIAGHRIQQGLYRQQFARPFEAAGALEQLGDMRQRRELQAADIEHLRAVNQHLVSGDEEKAAALMNTQRHQEALEANDNAKLTETNRRNEATESNALQKTQLELQREQQRQQGLGPWYSYKDPNSGKTTYNRIREGGTTPEGAQLVQGDYAQKQADRQTASAGTAQQSFIKHMLDNPSTMHRILGDKYNPKDATGNTKLLEQWYGQNTANGLTPNADGTFTYTGP